jgi:hypothetical protein
VPQGDAEARCRGGSASNARVSTRIVEKYSTLFLRDKLTSQSRKLRSASVKIDSRIGLLPEEPLSALLLHERDPLLVRIGPVGRRIEVVGVRDVGETFLVDVDLKEV